MFTKLTDFSYKRNWKEAIGFYLAYLLLTMLVGALLSGMAATLFLPDSHDFSAGFNFGVQMGTVAAVVITLVLSFLVLSKKKLLNNFAYILLSLVAGVLAYAGGGLLGLIWVAYLTTQSKK